MSMEKISFADMCAQVDARRKAENPWTAEDEARRQKKSDAERVSSDAYALVHPESQEDEPDDEEEET